MEEYDYEHLKAFNIKDSLEFSSNATVTKHIVRSKTGNIKALALDYGKVYEPKLLPFPTFIHIIDGKAEVVCNTMTTYMQNDDSMIIPGHMVYTIKANQPFKMLSVIIKSGYDALEP